MNAMQLPYLTDAEIMGMCEPLVQPGAQCKHLKAIGFMVKTKPNGKPLFKTVYVKTQIWAGYKDEDETGNGKQLLMEAMKASGLNGLVSETFNVQTLSGYVRSLNPDVKDPEELIKLVPEPMQPHLKVSKTVTLAVK